MDLIADIIWLLCVLAPLFLAFAPESSDREMQTKKRGRRGR